MDLPTIPPGYKPTDQEDYMSPLHLAYFQRALEEWKQELLGQAGETLKALASDPLNAAESTDRAAAETSKAFELRTRDRARKLIKKIDQALRRIDEGVYGYCVETGEPIGLKRLQARPIATLTLEAQEAHEKSEKMHRG